MFYGPCLQIRDLGPQAKTRCTVREKMAASPLANHTALVILQQAIPSRCPYPRSTVHNSNLCPHLRSSHIAERNLQIEKHQRKHFQHCSGSPFLIAAVKKVRCKTPFPPLAPISPPQNSIPNLFIVCLPLFQCVLFSG
jgi:hypothetical protein